MAYKYRDKVSTGFLCKKYGCTFSDPDFCKKRAESNIDDTCQICTDIEAITTSKSKHSKIVFSTKSMNNKKAA